jgi:hypothetical protein
MAGIAGLVSAGLGIAGALGGSDTASQVQLPSQFQMPHMIDSANGAWSGIANLPGTGTPSIFAPQFQNIAQSLATNPYAQMMQQGFNFASPTGQVSSTAGYNAGRTFVDAGTSLLPYAQGIEQTAFDPQNALYQRTQQQLVDQTRAGQAARGVATTPYGAAGESDALRKFDIDWQNNQLGRQVLGGQAATNLIGQGLQTSAGGTALANTSANEYANFGSLPYGAYKTIGNDQIAALMAGQQGVGGSQALALNPVQAYLNYLGVGNQAGGVANQQAQVGLNQAQLGFNQNQTLGSNLGAGIAGLGKSYSSGYPGASSAWNWLGSL